MGGSGRRWGAPVTWFTGRAAGVAGRRLAAVPRHYNRSSTSGSKESAQAHITFSPLTPPHPLPCPAGPTRQYAPSCLASSSSPALRHCKAEGGGGGGGGEGMLQWSLFDEGHSFEVKTLCCKYKHTQNTEAIVQTQICMETQWCCVVLPSTAV